MSTTQKTKEPTTTTATLDNADGSGEDLVKITFSFASRLLSHHKKVSLLQRILSCHETKNPKHYIDLRSSSKLFRNALQPPPLWTTFPHSNHATLQSLLDRLEQLRGDEESSGNVPSVLFIEEGEHDARWSHPTTPTSIQNYVTVKIPLSIYGAGREKTTLVGVGLRIKGKKSNGIVKIEDLTIQEGKGCGLLAEEGMNVRMKRISILECGWQGVFAHNADISCNDLQVISCGLSGVSAYGSVIITLRGMGTNIQRNGTIGYDGSYGLQTSGPSAKLQLVAPLVKEIISINNGSGGNWGGKKGSTIDQVDNDGVVLQILYEGEIEDDY